MQSKGPFSNKFFRIRRLWIRLWLSHTLECRLTNHSAAKNELRQRSDTFSQRSIDFNAGVSYFWSRQAITVVVLSKIWLNVVPGAFVTQIRVSQRGWRGVSVFFPSQNLSQILTSVVFGLNCVCGRPHSQLNPSRINKHTFVCSKVNFAFNLTVKLY